MFEIYANGKPIYCPTDPSLVLISPRLTLEAGKAGALEFSMPPNHLYYHEMKQLKTYVSVTMDGEEIFRGRVLSNDRNFMNIRAIYCEGDLSYLVDSVQKGEKFIGKAHDFFRQVINSHNKQMEEEKRFTVGDITIENRDMLIAGQSDDIQDAETGKFDYKQIALNNVAGEWQNTFDHAESCLIDYTGGYLRTRRKGNTVYIDLLKDYGRTSVQEIALGRNLLDLTEEVTAEDLFTVLVPLGDENLTIAEANNGSEELVDAAAVEKYGRIVKTHVFDSVTSPETLLENGRRYLESHANVPVSITVKAVDMRLVSQNEGAIQIGDKVKVNSAPHGLKDYLTCTKIEYDIEKPENNTYTFGEPKQELTERYRKDKQKQENEATRSGGGGGGGAGAAASEETQDKLDKMFDAWINVNPEQGHIDLGTTYKKLENAVETLRRCGIDMDAEDGTIDLRALNNQVRENGELIRTNSAGIQTVADDLSSTITEYTAWKSDITESMTKITQNVDDQGASITSITEWMDGNGTDDNKGAKHALTSVEQKSSANKASIESLAKWKDQETEAMAGVTNRVTKIEAYSELFAELDGSYSGVKASVSELQSDLELKVDKGGVIAAINASSNGNESTVTIKATRIDLDGYAKLKDLDAVRGDITSLTTGGIVATLINTKSLSVSGGLDAGSLAMDGSVLKKGSIKVGAGLGSTGGKNISVVTYGSPNYSIQYSDLPHSHSISVGSNGKLTLGSVTAADAGGSFEQGASGFEAASITSANGTTYMVLGRGA